MKNSLFLLFSLNFYNIPKWIQKVPCKLFTFSFVTLILVKQVGKQIGFHFMHLSLAWDLSYGWAVLCYRLPWHCGTQEQKFSLGWCRHSHRKRRLLAGEMRNHHLFSTVLQSSQIGENFIIPCMFPTLEERIDLGGPDCTGAVGAADVQSTDQNSGIWPQHLGLTLCPGSVQHSCVSLTPYPTLRICKTQFGLRKDHRPWLCVFGHVVWGRFLLLLCHVVCSKT